MLQALIEDADTRIGEFLAPVIFETGLKRQSERSSNCHSTLIHQSTTSENEVQDKMGRRIQQPQ